MVLNKAKPKYKQNTTWPGMRGRDAARKLTPKVNILQVFTIDFSEIQFIVNHNSQSDGQNTSAKSGMNLHKKTIHIVSLQRKREDTKGQWYLTLNKAGKTGLMKLRSDFRAAVSMKNRYPSRSIQTMASFFKHIVVEQVWMELYMSSSNFLNWSSFCYSWFWLQSKAIHFNRRGVNRYTSHAFFLMHLAHVITVTSSLKVSQCAFHSIHMPSMMSHVWACVCCLFVFVSFLFLYHFYLASFTVYVFSVRHTIFNVVTAEG